MATEALALSGGKPVRTTPFPRRAPFGEREIELVTQAIRSQDLFCHSGTMCKELELRFARFYGASHAVASSSGTAAIHIALGALNPSPGDEIITAPITDAGTIVPILYQGAIPVFAEVDSTYCMDPEDVERKITSRTRAILVVHLFGNPCDMDAMVDIARRRKVALIEDCSQAHCTSYKGKLLGQFGDIAAFSLQQSKHMTTGDGGMTITSRADLERRMMLFADKGWARRPGFGARIYELLAPNYRMTELQGAVGLAQLDKVRGVVERRNELGTLLTRLISGAQGLRPAPLTPGGKHSYWLYALGMESFDATDFAKALSAEGVSCGAHYIGKPIFLCHEAVRDQRLYGDSHYPFDHPNTRPGIKYDDTTCPITQRVLDRMVLTQVSQFLGVSDSFLAVLDASILDYLELDNIDADILLLLHRFPLFVSHFLFKFTFKSSFLTLPIKSFIINFPAAGSIYGHT